MHWDLHMSKSSSSFRNHNSVSTQEDAFQHVFPPLDICDYRLHYQPALRMQVGSPRTGQGFSMSNCQKEGRTLSGFSGLSCFTYWDQLPNKSLASNFLSQGLLWRQPRPKVIFDPLLHNCFIHSTASFLKVSNFSLFTC